MDATVKKRQGTRIRETGKDRVFNAFNLVFWILVLFIVLYPLWLILIASVSDPDAVLQARVTATRSSLAVPFSRSMKPCSSIRNCGAATPIPFSIRWSVRL